MRRGSGTIYSAFWIYPNIFQQVIAIVSEFNWTHDTHLVTSLSNWPLWTGRNPYTSTLQIAWVVSQVTTTP
jgi:hypothetical protein